MANIIDFTVKVLWGTMSFDFASIPSIGQSGGSWLASNSDLLFISVYSSQELPLKRALWTFLTHTIDQWSGEVVVMGDFNEVRYALERFGFVFHTSNAAELNAFIVNSHLQDIPLGGYPFTWSDKYANKISKLDRFLVSQGFLDLFLNISGLILHRNISDHRPILLKESLVDYCPTPFRLFHSWFLEDDFLSVVQDYWSIADNNSQNHMIKLKNKLKNLKHMLKAWSCDKKYLHNKERNLIQESLLGIDLRLDQGVGLPDDVLNHSRILMEGEWIENPARVKSEFYLHFSNRFAQPDWDRVHLVDQFLRVLSSDLSRNLEVLVSSDEIKKAIWDCGSDKTSGLDGFTLDFFKKYWSIVGNDVILAVKEFFSTGSILNGCNPSFIALIPKVLDAKLLNDFRPISLVGCQYKIISKILANRLSYVMDNIISQEQSAFVKGRQIIESPIILNEVIWWGLWQGDSLSPFLFILVMESLHISFQRLIDRGMFTPVTVGHNNQVSISHLFYADDVMFIGKCIAGIWVLSSTVHNMAAMFVCSASKLPFSYLGVNVGANMKKVSSWDVVINKVTAKLSSWKAKTLSAAAKLQSTDISFSFRRCPKSGIEESQLDALWLWTFIAFSAVGETFNFLPFMTSRRGRNAFLFSERKPLKGLIFDNFVSQTFNWVSNRCRSFNCNWVDLLKDPMTAISM
nr:RNA-directed DNA polymerase, eukaryota [Tanacetum cinerariifolium]